MGAGMRSWLARWLAILVVPAVVAAAVLAGLAPAASASPVSRGLTRAPAADAARLPAVSASLQAAIRESLGTSAFPADYAQRAELAASDGAAFNHFGTSVALSALGTEALVGAPGRDTQRGAAYVFTLRGGTWSRTAELTASDAAISDAFGISVALSALGTTALVGAFGHSRHRGGVRVHAAGRHLVPGRRADRLRRGRRAPSSGSRWPCRPWAAPPWSGRPSPPRAAGAAYVFTLRFGAWSQAAELTASDAVTGDEFGYSVALSALGTTALVGAPVHNLQRGAAYVFTPRFGTWSQAAELTASDAANLDNFGLSVALSALGTTALVGAPGRNSGAGAAYVFTPRFGTWFQAAELTATASGAQFGLSVASVRPGQHGPDRGARRQLGRRGRVRVQAAVLRYLDPGRRADRLPRVRGRRVRVLGGPVRARAPRP